MKRFLRPILFLFLSWQAIGSEVAVTLMPPEGAVVAGQLARVDLVALNPGTLETPFDIEAALSGDLKIGTNVWPIEFKSDGPVPHAVSAGGFAVRRFTFEVPSAAAGSAFLEIKRPNGQLIRGAIEVTAQSSPSPVAATAPQPAPTPLDGLAANVPAAATLSRTFAGRFLPNQPIYFVYGTGAQAAKFQFSFDYRIATALFGQSGDQTIATLRAGYTQRSLWDIDSKSSPFYDTSYMPELAINTDAPMSRDHHQFFNWLGLRAGVQHESNGKEGADSRSLNTVYFRPRFVLGSFESWNVVLLPEVFAYVGDLSDNKDLKNYRGYGRLRFYAGRNDGPTLMFTGWAGKNMDHGTYQLDLAIPTKIHWLNIESFLQLQYFNGYGESLRGYNRSSDAVRAGIGLVR